MRPIRSLPDGARHAGSDPMAFTMCEAFFAVHGGDPFAARELALVYLAVFVLMFVAGPGRYAADTLIARRLEVGEH